MDSASIANKPFLFEFTFAIPVALTGLSIRYKLEATNEIGSTISNGFLTAILAGIPPKPSSGPLNDDTQTSSSVLSVILPVVSDNGGSDIISYNLIMDDGLNGGFNTISGFDG